jgi:aminoglycoside phosphotransferase (APT) family kinase protein
LTDALVDLVNREHGRAWRLVGRLAGGRKTGAWEVEEAGERGVLKLLDYRCPRPYLDDVAALVARARSCGWPTPAWLAWGLDEEGHPYTVAELVDGEQVDQLDDAVLDALLEVVDRQRGIAVRSGVDRADARWSVFGDGSARWRAALGRHSPEALAAGEAIARLAAPFRDVALPETDLVHTDLGLHNVLFRDGEVAAVVDVEGIGQGASAIDLATLLFSTHSSNLAEERVLDRLVAYAVARDGPGAAAVCLAAALFDWAIFGTSGWEPDAVVAFLERASPLFARLQRSNRST